jgi:hypothetical protein
MSFCKFWPFAILAFLAMLLGSGCERVEQAQQADAHKRQVANLKALAAAFNAHAAAHEGQAPRSWDDLLMAGLDRGVKDHLEQAGYTVVLGINEEEALAGHVGGMSFMIAYPAAAVSKQYSLGYVRVLMVNGSTVIMEPLEFRDGLQQQEQLMANAVVYAGRISESQLSDKDSAPGPMRPPAPVPPPPPPIAKSLPAPPGDGSSGVVFTPPPVVTEQATSPAEQARSPFDRRGRGPFAFGPPGLGPRGAQQSDRGQAEARASGLSSEARTSDSNEAITKQPAPQRVEPEYIPPPTLPGKPTNLVGGPEGWQYEMFDQNRKAAVGFRYKMGGWGGQAAVAQLDPLFNRSEAAQNVVMARGGYVVGGFQVVAGDLVNAVRIIFVRQGSGGALDKSDFYLSDWIGDPRDESPKILGDGQTRVIGVCGRHGAVINALGLVLDKR